MKLTYNLLIHNPKAYFSCLDKLQINIRDGVKPLAPIGGVYLKNDCLIWTGGKDGNGYGTTSETIDGSTYTRKIHIISYMIYNKSELPQGMVINHICQQPLCVEPTHLIPNIPKYNIISAQSNRQSYNPKNKTWNITTPEIKRILVLYHVIKFDIKLIQKRFFPNLTYIRIYNIVKGKTYEGVHAEYYRKNFPFGRFVR